MFAGVVGCSKTPTSNYLSYNLKLPVFNNDAIRTEVIEDFGEFEEKIYLQRRDERLGQIISNRISFIYDASLDREYKRIDAIRQEYGYEIFIISFNLSKEFIVNLYEVKKYSESLQRVDELISDHERFLGDYAGKIGLIINDSDFKHRLELSLKHSSDFINSLR